MKPTILKVFSSFPKRKNILFNVKRNDEGNNVIRISHLDNDNQNQMHFDPLYNISGDGFSDEFPLCNYDESDISKDWNVLDDFYKFQEKRYAHNDDKKIVSGVSQTQQNQMYQRPNYSYTQLIYMAVESSPNKALNVNDIYSFCENNFPYYANAVNGWKNSLRHNLSINKCFKKITKQGAGGRGSLWVVDPREREHLVSTMYRSNITSFTPSFIIQKRIPIPEQVTNEDLLEWDQEQHNESLNGIILEKLKQDWTDTRLCDQSSELYDLDNCSVTSETDFNDWYRCVTSLEPVYPIKTHWYNQCHITPISFIDHDYCVRDMHTVLNNPSAVMRHSFVSSSNHLDSFSTSSDFNDEDWPRTPSPMSLHPLEPVQTYALTTSTIIQEPIKPSGKKRGRPRKDSVATTKLSKITPVVSLPTLSTVNVAHTQQSRECHNERINNMYNLNNFFNSL